MAGRPTKVEGHSRILDALWKGVEPHFSFWTIGVTNLLLSSFKFKVQIEILRFWRLRFGARLSGSVRNTL